MGKYNVTHKCGCEKEYQLFGKIADRERKIEYLKDVNCYKCEQKELANKLINDDDYEIIQMDYTTYKINKEIGVKDKELIAIQDTYNAGTKTINVLKLKSQNKTKLENLMLISDTKEIHYATYKDFNSPSFIAVPNTYNAETKTIKVLALKEQEELIEYIFNNTFKKEEKDGQIIITQQKLKEITNYIDEINELTHSVSEFEYFDTIIYLNLDLNNIFKAIKEKYELITNKTDKTITLIKK